MPKGKEKNVKQFKVPNSTVKSQEKQKQKKFNTVKTPRIGSADSSVNLAHQKDSVTMHTAEALLVKLSSTGENM